METNVSTGLKVWLWIVIVLNAISALGNIGSIVSSPVSTIISIALEAAMIYAAVLIMFQTKKLGFKIMCAVAVVNVVVTIITAIFAGIFAGALVGNAFIGLIGAIVGIIFSVILIAICPVLTYVLMKKDWDMFV